MPLLSKAKLKILRSLKHKKYREREQRFLIEGIKFCNEAFAADFEVDTFLYCPQIVSHEVTTTFSHECQRLGIPLFELTHEMLDDLSDTVTSQGVVAVLPTLQPQLQYEQSSLIIAVDAVQEPGNLGTIIRTADWFGADGVILGHGCADLYNPKVLRATMGSIFHLPIISEGLDSALQKLHLAGMTIYAAISNGGENINDIQFAAKKVLLLGNESQGIRDSLTPIIDIQLTIPGRGNLESLNVAIANGIILNQMVGHYE